MIPFYDEAMIRASSGLTRVPGPLRRLGTVLAPAGPAEGQRTMTFASSLVHLDPGWRLYYTVSDTAARMRGIAVAESEDGLVWRRPGLGQVRALGQDTPRLAIGGLPAGVERYGQPQVCRLDDGRWRMYFWINDRPYLRYVVAHSDDGLRWSVDRFDDPVLYHPLELGDWAWTPGAAPTSAAPGGAGPGDASAGAASGVQAAWGHLAGRLSPAELLRLKGRRSNDAVHVYRDPDSGDFELYGAWPMANPPGSPRRVEYDNAPCMLRVIHHRSSADGLTWGDAEIVLAPDEDDPIDLQFYYLSVHRQEGWRIGLLGRYLVADQTLEIELCFSRDGRCWQRPLRTGWLTREGAEEAGMVYAPNRLVPAGDDWLLLYTASPCRHREIPTRERAVVRAAAFPRRRFVGLAASGDRPGSLWTRPFVPGRPQIRLDARIDGWLRAELCDPFGAPLPGLGMDRCRVVRGDSTGHLLGWADAAVSAYAHDAVSLHLEWQDGTLFAIHGDGA